MNYLSNKGKAVLYMLLSSLCFAVMAALVKLSGDVPTGEKAFFRNFISFIVATIMIIKNKQSFWGNKENRKHLILRGIFGTIGMLFYFYCIDRMILADSSMLNKIHPFFITIFAVWFLEEKLSKVQVPSLILAFLGVILIIKPKFDMSVLPAIIGVLSAIFAAAAYTIVRYLGNKESSYTVVFYFSFISTLICLPLMMVNFQPLSFKQLVFLILSGVFAAIAQFALTISYRYAPASEVSIYNYTNIIFSQIIAFMLWREMPDIFSFIGYILIIGSSLLVFIYNKKDDNIASNN
ncbi:drug/metabolite transporter (DMT)-like permease [Clostridium tetanomorphum]|uniref:DMT family transporter n=2 Tax=Clostridium tetanomorphum TaxID=1553 RepID=A0A923E734_CLOTT|nr:DMT family transporter [Clostridium tetanomorphum]KAJ51799.1 membrane protein, transporter [Clostridium tetanomorphum DSM 665]MBC2397680.1 DMT family transporter [Clostridium tetanomorphum]MBP1865036.1 drug/metabolite transporter (DMT)-like permease [Clostridium tetanomorphum]NRS83366.1 drug/metabolite transporter (DMT)-like permease [Clostridium tetanomorphum]NRZ96566.1 drug/metabolite transporter (DMT)-like permease [Clostridium tetanomorphum]